MNRMLAAAIFAAAMIVVAASAQAHGPLTAGIRSIAAAAQDEGVTPVHYRRYGYGWRGGYYGGWGARPYYGSYGYWRPRYYGYYGPAWLGPRYYEEPVYVEPAPVYVAPRVYAPAGCWVETDSTRGYGYYRPC